MTEKILATHSNNTRVVPGQNIWTNVDKLLTHDVCGPGTFGIFQKEFGENAQVRRRALDTSPDPGERPKPCARTLDAPKTEAFTSGCVGASLSQSWDLCRRVHGSVPTADKQRRYVAVCTLSAEERNVAAGVGSGGRHHHPGSLHFHLGPPREPQRRHIEVRPAHRCSLLKILHHLLCVRMHAHTL